MLKVCMYVHQVTSTKGMRQTLPCGRGQSQVSHPGRHHGAMGGLDGTLSVLPWQGWSVRPFFSSFFFFGFTFVVLPLKVRSKGICQKQHSVRWTSCFFFLFNFVALPSSILPWQSWSVRPVVFSVWFSVLRWQGWSIRPVVFSIWFSVLPWQGWSIRPVVFSIWFSVLPWQGWSVRPVVVFYLI